MASATATATTTSTSAAPPLGKFLASTEKKTRDKAIRNLALFLSQEDHVLPSSEMSKLWKGIFYCFWMSDKPLVQQALADELAELVLTIESTEASLNFLRGFWECTIREWNGIDRLRIDKYYLLIRRFVNASFRLLIGTGFEADTCKEYNDILTCSGGPLCPNDIKVPQGLSYHLSDIYLEELDKALAQTTSPTSDSSSDSIPPSVLQTIVSPFFELAALTPNNMTYKRVQESLIEPFFSALPSSSSDDDQEEGRSKKRARTDEYPHILCRIDAKETRTLLAKAFFDTASRESTRDSNRRKMYKLWRSLGEDMDEDG